MLNTVWADVLDSARTEQVRALLQAARASDGRPEIEPDGPLPGEFAGGSHLLGYAGDDLAGYAHLDTAGDAFGRQVAELIVHPRHRRRGHGAQLAGELLAVAKPDVRVWAHGDHPAAARIAARSGLSRVRELLVMHVAVEGADWPEPALPEGVTLRTFVPGRDEEAVIAVNARAFDWHPEQGAFSVEQLREAERESWFDPDGFFLAENAEGQVIGFHWTKVHPPNPERFGGRPMDDTAARGASVAGGGGRRVGEVYVVGVDPGAQGGGLGRALTLAGLRHLRERGLRQVILYVEGDNAPAVAVYRKLGFAPREVDVQYARA
ncbi:mycothiol synthase [Prauserella muralis]|uniref:Mycothiol acetyltransferase n=1 Tax=Prauserella muralis TaxID=588067 RepID=A0A2V4B852_9PSEU|nr:mycothiol synthase [Prauserella muralis]PXY31417.1 mycothiol synthase [Prauserella muralis]TWE14251.1 mycothiol synthase [Prauserella muralis]